MFENLPEEFVTVNFHAHNLGGRIIVPDGHERPSGFGAGRIPGRINNHQGEKHDDVIEVSLEGYSFMHADDLMVKDVDWVDR